MTETTTTMSTDLDLLADIQSLLEHDLPDSFLEPGSTSVEPPRFTPGERFGHFEIEGAIGAGGMGEVWRARDLSLGRAVALKFVSSRGPVRSLRQQRFEREARALASVNHPNVGAIFGIETRDGLQAIVLELIEGLG